MKKTFSIFLASIYAILFLSGCTANLTEPEINFEPPVYVEQMPAKEDKQDFVSTGSIFGQGDNPLFSDHKAMHINDIVTVSISETATSTSNGAKSLTEDDSLTLGGGVFTSGGGSNRAIRAGSTALNGVTNASFGAASNSAYTGAGSSSKDASFTTTISARIVKVLQNGNYFITGKREILVDEQKQIIQISGVIRPYDIDQYNQIDSSKISDAKILYETQGDLDRATKQGWGSKIVNAVWPF